MRARPVRLLVAMLIVLSSVPVIGSGVVAQGSQDAFDRVWERTDQPVSTLAVSRTWMWGPQPNSGILQEEYAEAPGGLRDVQYWDKSRMEITDPAADQNSIWYVTNGLLVVEMITGMLQVGDDEFLEGTPAGIVVAGDLEDENGPTYATLTDLAFPHYLVEPATGDTVIQRLARDGIVTDEAGLAERGITLIYWDDLTEHNIAAPFWQFMNSSGLVLEDGQLVEGPLFLNAFYATGRPITEPYWATVEVAGVAQDVLLQCFERRCLTYTPDNPEGWKVEAGNVGLHYFQWRSEFETPEPPPPPPPPTGDPTALRINEVMFQPQGSNPEWVELFNSSDNPVSLSGMRLANGSLVNQITLPDWSMPAGAYLQVVFGAGEADSDFGDGSATYYSGTAGLPFFTPSAAGVALYEDAPSDETILDFVAWGFAGVYTAGNAHNHAVDAEIWTSGAFFEGIGAVPEQSLQGQERLHMVWIGESIGRDANSSDTNTPADWGVLGGADALGPTPGAANASEFLDELDAILSGETSASLAQAPSIPMAAKDWTVMVYMDARAPELARPLAAEIQALLGAGSNGDVNIVVAYATEDAAFRAYLQDGELHHITVDENPNPGSQSKLGGFIQWASFNFPADNNAIVFSGHGRGWKGIFQSSPESDFLTMSELEAGLISLGKKFDVVKFDTNLMANVEVAFQIALLADYMVASEQATWGHFPWPVFIDDLKADPDLTGEEVAGILVDRHADRYDSFIASIIPPMSARAELATYTWAALDLNVVQTGLKPALDGFASALEDDVISLNTANNPNDNGQIVIKTTGRGTVAEYADANFIDLYRFAELIGTASLSAASLSQSVMDNVDAAVIELRKAPGGSNSHSHGLSIYFPRTQDLPHYPNNPPATGPHVGPDTPILRSSNGFDNPLFDPRVSIPTRGTHLYSQDPATNIRGTATQYHPMEDDNFFKFTGSAWAEFLHRYYKPVADACIVVGSTCVNSHTMQVGEEIDLSAAGSSDSDGPVGPMNNTPALYYWDFNTIVETGGTMPAYIDGQQYATCAPGSNDCDRDGDNGTDDDPDAVGVTVPFTCDTVGTFTIRLMVWDEHHQQGRIAHEDQRHNDGRHWLHFNVDTATVEIECVPYEAEKETDVSEAEGGESISYTITMGPPEAGATGYDLDAEDVLSEYLTDVTGVECNIGECEYVVDDHQITWTIDADDFDEFDDPSPTLEYSAKVIEEAPDDPPEEIMNCVDGTVNGYDFVPGCVAVEVTWP